MFLVCKRILKLHVIPSCLPEAQPFWPLRHLKGTPNCQHRTLFQILREAARQGGQRYSSEDISASFQAAAMVFLDCLGICLGTVSFFGFESAVIFSFFHSPFERSTVPGKTDSGICKRSTG